MNLIAHSLFVFLLLWRPCYAAIAVPLPIIFDTDMDTDCDDAGAMAVLHALADRGECEILGTMVSTRHPGAGPTVAAINAYYGRPDLPVGCVKKGGVEEPSRFARKIAEEFPQPLKFSADAPDATLLYRDILEKQPDGSVVVVTVGYLTNLRHLLELPADDDHLSGKELVRRKVKTYVCIFAEENERRKTQRPPHRISARRTAHSTAARHSINEVVICNSQSSL